LPLKVAVDNILGPHPLPDAFQLIPPRAFDRSGLAMLGLTAGLLVGIALLRQLQDLASALLRAYTGEKLVLAFRAQLFRHVQRLSLSYHDTQGTTDSAYRIHWDAPCIQHIAIDGVIPFLTALTTLVLMLVVIVWLDWQLALIALAVCPLFFLVTHLFRNRLRRQSREVNLLENSALSLVQEVLTAVRVVKAFGQEGREQQRFVDHSSRGMRARLRMALAEGGFALLVGLTSACGMAGVLFLGVRHVQTGSLTLGEFLLVVAYLTQLYTPLETISKKVADLQASLACAERAFALLDEQPDVVDYVDASPLERAKGEVVFRNVSFAYRRGVRVLHDLSFAVAPGARVGIAGTTGAGKTTLVSLLNRLYDPDEGHILLDGADLRDYRLADLRNQFAIVLQEPLLFSTTIAENIAYARPGATESEIRAAAQAANADDFISRLPQGYQTQVGERGMQLSGGERQRIALARAFLKDAPVLIFDEPTSSVDLRTEADIMEALERLSRGRTTFIIAHRLSTLEQCDVRLRIESGRLVEMEALERSAVGEDGSP
jgi:ATP-binding cassette subfamily B protein